MLLAAAGQFLYTGQVYHSSLLLLVVLAPIAAGVGLYFFKSGWEKARKAAALAACLFSLAGVVYLLPFALKGEAYFDLVNFMQMGLFFRVDLIAWVFAFLITFVWALATIFSFAYMDFEHNRPRFYSVLTVTLGATLGVVMAGDFFTLFLFFELMTLSSFILVIHEQDREAMDAGMLYLYLGIAGGLCLLFAIMMLYAGTGSVGVEPVFDLLGPAKTVIYVCFLIGFGIKAGLVPLHIWLPRAHPVAPSPASALLSGIMIKTGAYGILRVSLILYSRPTPSAPGEGTYLFNAGGTLMWIGIVTMFLGALMALLQSNMKRVLAYSSVSQIGYIATGIGVAMMMGIEGAMGFAGSIYHIINHAFFKAGLFMMVGTIYIYTHELDMNRLGGFIKKMPLVGAAFVVAALGIAGMPGFNGYPSKTLIHDSLLVAIKFYDLFHIEVAEKIFTLTSALTICYFIKLFRGVFLGPVPENLDRSYPLPASIKFVLSAFALIIMTIGLFPNLILERLIVPAAETLGYKGYGMDHLYHFHFFEWHPLEAMLIVGVLAALIYLPGARRGWFDWKAPAWLSIEAFIYRPLSRLLVRSSCRAGVIVDSAVDDTYTRSGQAARAFCSYFGLVDKGVDRLYERSGQAARSLADRSRDVDSGLDSFYEKTGEAARRLADRSREMDEKLDNFYENTGRKAYGLADRTRELEEGLDRAYQKTGDAAKKLAERTSDADRALNRAYDAAGKKTRLEMDKIVQRKREKPGFFDRARWSTKNLSFDTLIMALVLAAVLFIVFYFGRNL